MSADTPTPRTTVRPAIVAAQRRTSVTASLVEEGVLK
jgi:hypothetical protein